MPNRHPSRRRLVKVAATTLTACLVAVGVSFWIYQEVQSRHNIVIGDTTITPKQVQSYASAASHYQATNKNTSLGGNPTDVAQDDLILNAALKEQAKQHGITVTHADLDASLALAYKYYGSKAGYQQAMKSMGIFQLATVRSENKVYEAKLENVLIAQRSIFLVAVPDDVPYFNKSSNPEVLRQQARQLLTNKFLPLFKAGDSKEAIAKQADVDMLNPNSPAVNNPPFSRMFTSAQYLATYSLANPYFMVEPNQKNIPQAVSINDKIAALTKVGQNTGVITTDSGIIAIVRLEAKSSGIYASWDQFLQSYKAKYAKQLSFNANLHQQLAQELKTAEWPFATLGKVWDVFKPQLAAADDSVCSHHFFTYHIQAADPYPPYGTIQGVRVVETRNGHVCPPSPGGNPNLASQTIITTENMQENCNQAGPSFNITTPSGYTLDPNQSEDNTAGDGSWNNDSIGVDSHGWPTWGGGVENGANGVYWTISVIPPQHDYHASLTTAGCKVIEGYAYDADHPDNDLDVTIAFSGGPGGSHNDLTTTTHGSSSSDSSANFQFNTPSWIANDTGNANVKATLTVLDPNNTNYLVGTDSNPIQEPCSQGGGNQTPTGNLTVSCTEADATDVEDPDHPSQEVEVNLYVGSTAIDPNPQLTSDHQHKFTTNWANYVTAHPGTISATLKAQDIDNGNWYPVDTESVTCGGGSTGGGPSITPILSCTTAGLTVQGGSGNYPAFITISDNHGNSASQPNPLGNMTSNGAYYLSPLPSWFTNPPSGTMFYEQASITDPGLVSKAATPVPCGGGGTGPSGSGQCGNADFYNAAGGVIAQIPPETPPYSPNPLNLSPGQSFTLVVSEIITNGTASGTDGDAQAEGGGGVTYNLTHGSGSSSSTYFANGWAAVAANPVENSPANTYEIIWAADGAFTCVTEVTLGTGAPVSYPEPFFTVKGGDVLAGSGAEASVNGTCAVPASGSAGISSWYDSSSTNGAGTQFGASARAAIQDFVSGLDTHSNMPGSLLFANNTGLSSSTGAEVYGGFLGAVPKSCPDYLAGEPSTANAPFGETVDISTLSSGTYLEAQGDGPLIVEASGPILPGRHITIYNQGDIEIEDNIVYGTDDGKWDNASNIPSVTLVADGVRDPDTNDLSGNGNGNGNIFINYNVTEVDGTFVADPSPNFVYSGIIESCGGGVSYGYGEQADLLYDTGIHNNSSDAIWTCSAGGAVPSQPVSHPLKVYGSFIAKQIRLYRAFDSVTDSSPTPSESFTYGPEDWIGAVESGGSGKVGSQYQAITSLPPVL